MYKSYIALHPNFFIFYLLSSLCRIPYPAATSYHHCPYPITLCRSLQLLVGSRIVPVSLVPVQSPIGPAWVRFPNISNLVGTGLAPTVSHPYLEVAGLHPHI